MHLCNRVDRRSKSQNISELAFSLNRYHNSATPLFYSETQSDISFLIILSAKIVQTESNGQRKAEGFALALLRCRLSLDKIGVMRLGWEFGEEIVDCWVSIS